MQKTKSLALILGVLTMSFLVGCLVLAWTEPGASPPGANVPAPINVGSAQQWKEGGLGVGTKTFDLGSGQVAASIFYDRDNSSWYVNPAGTSVFSGNVGIGTTAPGAKLDVQGGRIRGQYEGQFNSATIGTVGWYRIASNSGNRANAEFTLRDYISGGGHSTLTFKAGVSYDWEPGMSFTLLNHNYYSTPTFTKIRVWESDYTYDPMYVEVYVARTGSMDYSIYDNLQSAGWTPVAWTAGGTPTGTGTYTAREFEVNNLFTVGDYDDRFTIARGGNVGIGTTAPSQKLDVAGNINGQSIGATQYCINPSGGCVTSWAQIAGTGGWTDDGTTVRLTTASDNVGIGTTAPNTKLELKGGHGDTTLRMYSTGDGGANDAYLSLWASEPGWTYTGAGIGNNINRSAYYGRINTGRGASYIRLLDNAISLNTVTSAGTDTNNMYMSGGNVGIGTASPSQKLHIAGNLQVDGAIVAPEGTLRDDGGGWVRTYGNTGWYSQTYGGGWYMADTSWIRSYGSKNVYINTMLRADGGFQVDGYEMVGSNADMLYANRRNTTGGGIWISDDGGFYDYNNAYVDFRGSTGVRILESDGTWGNNSIRAANLCIQDDCRSSWPAGGDISGSGSTNYVTKFTGTKTIGNSQIYDTGTNVGIGTASPGYKLDVSGNMRTTGRYYSNEWIQMDNYSGLYSPLNGAHFYPNNASYGSWRVAGSRNGWQGLEFDAAGGQLSLMMGHTSQGWGGQQTGIHNNSYGWLWRFDHRRLNAGSVYLNDGGVSNYFAGNVGIGTTVPGARLDLEGGNIIDVNKISVNTIDPVFKINNKKYASYVPDVIGKKVEVIGVGKLTDGKWEINLANQEDGSDLWLFYNVVKRDTIIPFISSQDKADLYGYLDETKFVVELKDGEKEARFSYLLIGKRIDSEQGENVLSEEEAEKIGTYIDVDSLR